MKRLWDLLVLVLALNFIAVAGVAGWIVKSRNVDREKLRAGFLAAQ